MTPEELYGTIYTLSNYGKSPSVKERAQRFYDWIVANVPLPASAMDLGCGCGLLVDKLRAAGYEAYGTEIVKDLCDERRGISLARPGGYPGVHSRQYELVISNDVLEHLDDEIAVVAAVTYMARLSRLWICVSVGYKESHVIFNDVRYELHKVVRPVEWWRNLFASYWEIVHEEVGASSYFAAMRRRGPTGPTGG